MDKSKGNSGTSQKQPAKGKVYTPPNATRQMPPSYTRPISDKGSRGGAPA